MKWCIMVYKPSNICKVDVYSLVSNNWTNLFTKKNLKRDFTILSTSEQLVFIEAHHIRVVGKDGDMAMGRFDTKSGMWMNSIPWRCDGCWGGHHFIDSSLVVSSNKLYLITICANGKLHALDSRYYVYITNS